MANSARQVVAKAPNGDVFMLLQLVQQPQGASVQDDRAWPACSRPGFRLCAASARRSAGSTPTSAPTRGRSRDWAQVASRAAHIRYGDNVYMIAGLAPPAAFEQDTTARSTAAIRSFRLAVGGRSGGDQAGADRAVQRAGRATPGPRWPSRSGGAITAAALAAMNHTDAGRRRTRGARLKIVVAG